MHRLSLAAPRGEAVGGKGFEFPDPHAILKHRAQATVSTTVNLPSSDPHAISPLAPALGVRIDGLRLDAIDDAGIGAIRAAPGFQRRHRPGQRAWPVAPGRANPAADRP